MTATRQKIHAAMRKAKITRSKSHTTRIRGWHNISPGYELVEREDGFYVAWRNSYGAERLMTATAREHELQRYEAALAAFGPTRGTWWDHPCVVILK